MARQKELWRHNLHKIKEGKGKKPSQSQLQSNLLWGFKLAPRHFVNLPLYQLAFFLLVAVPTFHFGDSQFNQLVISATCHFVNLPLHQLAFFLLVVVPTFHFGDQQFHQLVILSTCCLSNLQFSSTCHCINLPFYWFVF